MPDYSCYITLVNKLNVALKYHNKGVTSGYYASDPPSTIAANSTSKQFQLKDKWGAYGSEGWVQYRVDLADIASDDQKPLIYVYFTCPTGNNDNIFSMSASTASSLFNCSNTDYPKRDHPLTVTGTIDFNFSMTTSASIASVKVPSPKLNVYNTKGELHKQTNMEIWNSINPDKFEDNDTPGLAGSLYPVSLDISQDANMNIVFNVDKNLVSVPFYISGSQGSDEKVLSSDNPQFFTSEGQQTISLTMNPDFASKTFPWCVVGNIIWKVSIGATSQVINLNSSRVEAYAVTKSLPTFFANKIKVIVLRAFVRPARASGETDWATYVIKNAFSTFGVGKPFVYDTYYGAPAFGCIGTGGNYLLSKWCSLINTSSRVNCYDQAGIVQIGLGLGLNGQSTWKFMSPYGYIMKTNLIGVGNCNNPFYNSNNTQPIIGNNDPSRTGFGNHAFITVQNKNNFVADACAGPHVVEETLSTYVDNAVQKAGDTDQTTKLYSSNPGMGPGTPANATDQAGVTSIDGGSVASNETDKTRMASARAFVQRSIVPAALTSAASPMTVINADLNKIHEFLTKDAGLTVLYHSYDVLPDRSRLTWTLETTSEPIQVEISILSDNEAAKSALVDHLVGYQRDPDDIFIPATDEISKGGLCFVERPQRVDNHSRMIWVRGNVFTHVSGPVPIQQLDKKYLKSLDSVFVAGGQAQTPGQDLEVLEPEIRLINAPQQVKVGDEFAVFAEVDNCRKSNAFNGQNDIIVLLSSDIKTQTFRFRAEKAGTEKLQLAFAHSVTGKVASKTVDITVF